jgi:hypothetical protein
MTESTCMMGCLRAAATNRRRVDIDQGLRNGQV